MPAGVPKDPGTERYRRTAIVVAAMLAVWLALVVIVVLIVH